MKTALKITQDKHTILTHSNFTHAMFQAQSILKALSKGTSLAQRKCTASKRIISRRVLLIFVLITTSP